jgi:hypothetical protein
MQLLISDANILIDMEEGELLPQMFQLPYNFSIPDILFYEELEQEHNHLIELGLRLDELEGELVSYSVALVEQYRKPSRNDCFALALAKHHQCPLLNEAVVVMGTVWLLKQLVILQLITADEARTSLTLMKNAGRRLPWRRAEEYILEAEQQILKEHTLEP